MIDPAERPPRLTEGLRDPEEQQAEGEGGRAGGEIACPERSGHRRNLGRVPAPREPAMRPSGEDEGPAIRAGAARSPGRA